MAPMTDPYGNMATIAGMAKRGFRARIIREFIALVLEKTREYHTSKAAQDTMWDVEEMLGELWKLAGITHGRKSDGK